MDSIRYVALSRQMGLWKQMESISNNMANMNTSGFKGSETLFRSYVAETQGAEGVSGKPVYFTQDFASFQDFSEGPVTETGNTFDISIQGDAFFAVEDAAGEKYTRKGQFQLDKSGMIVNNQGHPLLSENGTPFFIAPTEKEVIISPNGDVTTENGVIGKIKLVKFEDNQSLLNIGGAMFENASNTKASINADAKVTQGTIEKSNVNSITEMTKLINVQRSYEFVQQMIDQEHSRISDTISVYSQLA